MFSISSDFYKFKFIIKIFALCIVFLPSVVTAEDIAPKFIATPDNVVAVVKTNRTGRSSQGATIYKGAGKYYYQPAMLPDWTDYIDAVNTACYTDAGEILEEQKEIELAIWLDSSTYFDELVKELGEYGLEAFSDKKLFYIPHDFLRVALVLDGVPEVIIPKDNRDLSVLTNGFSVPQRNSVEAKHIVALNKTCAEHVQLSGEVSSGEPVLEGYLYRVGQEYQSTSIHMLASLSLHESLIAELFSEEATKIEVSTSGDSRTMSMNLPVNPFPGQGAVRGKVSLDAQRIVTRDVLDELVSKVLRRASLRCTGYECENLMKASLPTLLGEAFGEAIISRAKDGYVLVGEQFGYVTITDSQIKGKIENKLDTTKENKKQGNVKFKGFEAGFENFDKNIANTSGAGEIDTKLPVATIADVVVVSRDQINSILDFELSQDIPQDGQSLLRVKLLYPSRAFADGFISTEDEQKDLVALEKQCRAGLLRISKSYVAKSKSDKGTKPNAATNWVTANALQGKYIESFTARATSSHNARKEERSLNVMRIGSRNIPVVRMISSTQARFFCKQGSSAPKRRSCTARGLIATKQQPLACAQFLVPDYLTAIGE